uniref:Tetratricopeptide repeat protein n=1 Tax=candidate division WOR-3 bacterium TaxID=2052148 RepID=A0A7C3J5G6_UNCW3
MRKIFFITMISLLSLMIFTSELDFAKFLFDDGDYYRSLTELKRELFFCQDTQMKEKIVNLIGVNYLFMGDLKSAEESFSKIKDISEGYEKNYLLTLFFQKKFKDLKETKITFEKNNDFVLLSKLFLGEVKEKDFINSSEELKEISDNFFKIKKKNPFLAILFSTFLPGSGRFYSERNGDGLFSMMTILTPILGSIYYKFINENKTFFVISTSVAAVFYLGELYGSFNSAKIYYEKKVNRYFYEIKDNYSNTIFLPYYSF